MVCKVTPKYTHIIRQKNNGVMVLILLSELSVMVPETYLLKSHKYWKSQTVVIQRFGDFSSVGYRIVVGVIRLSSRKVLRRKDLVGIAQIFGILKKNLRSLIGQGFRGFLR